jgi:ATP-dependent Clp protease ATP-binding subunit ClpA
MFERFTDRARKVMALANQEAIRFNNDYIETEHILIGLLKEGSGLGATALRNLKVDLKIMQDEVSELMTKGLKMIETSRLPHTKEAKRVIKHALGEARMLSSEYLGTEHLLLGIMRETEGITAQVMKKHNLTYEQVRNEVVNLAGSGKERQSPAGKFTDRARTIMSLANREAQRYNHESIDAEHILLGFIKEGSGVGMTVLKNLNVDIVKLRSDVERRMIKSPDEVATGKPALSPVARKVMEYAIEWSKTLKRNYVGSEHILLGLMYDVKGNKAAEILKSYGVTEERIRNGIVEVIQ